MNKVFIVTEGQYSDYHIEAVFSNEDKAKRYMKSFPKLKRHGKIVEWPIDPEYSGIPISMKCIDVTMYRNGDSDADDISEEFGQHWQEPLHLVRLQLQRSYLTGYVFALDEQHAIKIANEHRAQLIANNEWPPDKEEEQ